MPKDQLDLIFEENVKKLPRSKRPGSPHCLHESEDGYKCTKPKGHGDKLHVAVGRLGYVHCEWAE